LSSLLFASSFAIFAQIRVIRIMVYNSDYGYIHINVQKLSPRAFFLDNFKLMLL